MSTGLPVTVTSARKGQDFVSRFVLDIDIHKNEPNIHVEEKLPNPDKWHGAELSVIIEGNWTTYRSKILKYLRQLAVITPYAEFQFRCASRGACHNTARIIHHALYQWMRGLVLVSK